ncbi:hypothetical protein ACFFWC_21740 [Plantactinospora siamensis]|uniref:Uncharacterized protein n=1 Tax=Plantactinospora siamensis TaxID=555372 RepID=A0ABV6P5B6_9ACTN
MARDLRKRAGSDKRQQRDNSVAIDRQQYAGFPYSVGIRSNGSLINASDDSCPPLWTAMHGGGPDLHTSSLSLLP